MFYSVAMLDLVSMQLALKTIDIQLISTAFIINKRMCNRGWCHAKLKFKIILYNRPTYNYFLKYTQVIHLIVLPLLHPPAPGHEQARLIEP